KLCCQGLQTAHVAIRPAIIDPNSLPLGPSQALKFRCECCEFGVCLRVGFTHKHQYADPSYAVALLRARRERPRGRAAEERYELAPLHFRGHSMTSSARASNLSGIVKPSAFAVLKSSRQLGDELMPFWL